MKKWTITPSSIDGQGVFATLDIQAGEIVFFLKGRQRRRCPGTRPPSLPCPLCGAWIGIGKKLWIDPLAPANFANHSCAPTIGIRGQVTFVALRNITKGEELCFDYSITEEDTSWTMPCRCGAADCRKVIRSIQSLPPVTVQAYLPAVPKYFLKVWARNSQMQPETGARNESSPPRDIKLFARSLFRIKPSAQYGGIGLFAVQNIKRGSVIAKWEDLNEELFFSWQDFEKLDDATREMVIDYCAQTEDGFYAPRNINLISLPWHMNHCCDGNVGFNIDGDFVAIKDVARGEELAYDYGLVHTKPSFKLTCKCGVANCRKRITGNDWKDPDFQRKNHEYMTPEIREMIDAENLKNGQGNKAEFPDGRT